MIQPQQQFFLSDYKIHTVASSACVLPPPADHIYEVFRVISGVAMFIEDHVERLQKSLNAAGIHAEEMMILKQVRQLIELNRYAPGNIKIIFWKSGNEVHNIMFYDKHQYPDEAMLRNGVVIGAFGHERKNPNVKLFDSEMRTNAARMISDNNFYEVLLISSDNRITEGSRSNIFFISDNRIITPPSDQVLEGVTRKKVISLIQTLDIDFVEVPVFVDSLKDFNSVFLTGTSRRVLPVLKIEPYTNNFHTDHQLIRTLQNEFANLCEQYITSKRPSQ